MPDLFKDVDDVLSDALKELETYSGPGSILGAGELVIRLANDGVSPMDDGAEKTMVMQAAATLSEAPTDERSKVLLEALGGEHVADLLDRYPEVAVALLPELAPSVGFDQHSAYHNHDVYGHLVETIRHVPDTVEMRLAALLHDVGKPATFTIDKAGMGHFPGHPEKSVEITKPILERLKLSPSVSGLVTTVIRYHDYFMIDQTPMAIAALAETVRLDPDATAAGLNVRDVAEIGIMMRIADIQSQAPDAPDGGMEKRLAAIEAFRPVAAEALATLGFGDESSIDAREDPLGSATDEQDNGDDMDMDAFDGFADDAD